MTNTANVKPATRPSTKARTAKAVKATLHTFPANTYVYFDHSKCYAKGVHAKSLRGRANCRAAHPEIRRPVKAAA